MAIKETIKIEKKYILLLRYYVVFMSGIIMLYLNMCHNKNFISILNHDYGLAQLMKNIAYMIILLLMLFYCYLQSFFWKKLYYQLGVIFALGNNPKTVIKNIMKQRIKEMFICMMIGISLGYMCYIFVSNYLIQNKKAGFVSEPIILLTALLGLVNFTQYKLMVHKSIMDFMKSSENKFRTLNCSIVFYRVLAVICLVAGFAGVLYLKQSDIVITSLWRSIPIVIEVVGLYLIIKYWILFFLKEREGNDRRILLIEYIRCEFSQLSLIVSSVAATAFLSIFVTTIVLCSSTSISKEVLEYDKPFEVVFDIVDHEEEISDYIRKAKEQNAEVYHIQYLMGNLRWSTDKFDLPIMIIKQSDYNELSKEKISIPVGSAVMLSQVDKSSVMVMEESDGSEWSFLPLGEIEFEYNGIQKIFLAKEIWNIVFNLQDQSLRTLILNENDYNNLISTKSNEINKFMIHYKGSPEAKEIMNQMLQNVTVNNLIIREDGIHDQAAQRKIEVAFTFLTALVMFACLILFQMLRLISEKEKWKHSRKILGVLGVEKIRLYKEIKERMNIQTLYPALGGGLLGLAFSQVYIRQFNFSIFVSTSLIYLFTLLLEFIWRKYTVYYLSQKD